jgi:hypothetical protein
MIVMIIASTASLNASSRLVVMRVSLESHECRSRRLPRHRQLVSCSRAGSPREWGALADWLARQVADTAEVHPAVRGCPGLALCRRGTLAHRVCIHALSGCQLTATLPVHLLDRDSTRKIANPRPPGSRDTAQRDSWRFTRQVGNSSAACAAAGAVHLARIAPRPQPEARHREHLIGPSGPPANHLAPNREPAQRYSTWKRGTRRSALC